ncbi:hypothetical protein ACKI1S_48740, partial [Streptomyces galilaeus]
MNASLEFLPVAQRHSASTALAPQPGTLAALATDLVAREGILEIPGLTPLYHGGTLSSARIA